MRSLLLITALLFVAVILSGVLVTAYRRLFPKPIPKRYTSLSRRSAPSHIQAWLMARAIQKRERRGTRRLVEALLGGWYGGYGGALSDFARRVLRERALGQAVMEMAL